MAELMINLRFSEPQEYILLDVNYVTIVPASELLYECKVQGPYYHSTSYLVSARAARICSSGGPFGAPWCL
mgnify:CR=1 FL=1